jgi:hypothetical protein
VAIQPEPPGQEAPADRTTRRGGWRFGVWLAVLVVGTGGLAASAAGVSAELLPRTFTPAQQQQIMAWETAGRWRAMPAGDIFPATITYQLPAYAITSSNSQLTLKAYRVGISRQSSCAAASDAAAAKVLSADRCAAELRATYADETDSMLVTVGVAVMPGNNAAKAAAGALGGGQGLHPGVRTAAFRSTLAQSFSNRQRQLSWAVSSGPYLIMSTVGYVDGLPRVQVTSNPYEDQEMMSFATGVADAIGAPIGAQPAAPKCPGSPGC